MLLIGLPILYAGGCSLLVTPAPPPDSAVTAAGVLKTYRTYRHATSKPIGPSLFYDCRAPLRGVDSPWHWDFFDPRPSDDNLALHVYVNDVAWSAMGDLGQRTFPAGSVVVKEKLGDRGVGIMIKREAGFATARGDWEYAYSEAGELQTDQEVLAPCAACHLSGRGPSGTDGDVGGGIVMSEVPRDSVFLSVGLPREAL